MQPDLDFKISRLLPLGILAMTVIHIIDKIKATDRNGVYPSHLITENEFTIRVQIQ